MGSLLLGHFSKSTTLQLGEPNCSETAVCTNYRPPDKDLLANVLGRLVDLLT